MKLRLISFFLGMTSLFFLGSKVNAVPLEPGTFICQNNPTSECKNPPNPTLNTPAEKGNFVCVNNPNPQCENPFPVTFSEKDLVPGSFACLNNPTPKCNNPSNYERDRN